MPLSTGIIRGHGRIETWFDFLPCILIFNWTEQWLHYCSQALGQNKKFMNRIIHVVWQRDPEGIILLSICIFHEQHSDKRSRMTPVNYSTGWMGFFPNAKGILKVYQSLSCWFWVSIRNSLFLQNHGAKQKFHNHLCLHATLKCGDYMLNARYYSVYLNLSQFHW